ncbi:MAG: hypothetical protein LC777_17860 [Actinobacteria bacterium]|nr:hypothetical protein [Actinomycetota bacterium]
MRLVVAALLLILAAPWVVVAWGPLENLFAEYQDSPDSTYLLFGLPPAIAGAAFLAAAGWVLYRHRER